MREQTKYRKRGRKDGRFSPNICEPTAERIRRYCEIKDINKTKFVEQCVNDRLDALEREFYDSLTKEELISIIMKAN